MRKGSIIVMMMSDTCNGVNKTHANNVHCAPKKNKWTKTGQQSYLILIFFFLFEKRQVLLNSNRSVRNKNYIH
uniref:Uncharacterized protein n=1 Tax=Octopus bimaculoides TaxID=37653 RepID=A0A0L8GUV2_OCTBM